MGGPGNRLEKLLTASLCSQQVEENRITVSSTAAGDGTRTPRGVALLPSPWAGHPVQRAGGKNTLGNGHAIRLETEARATAFSLRRRGRSGHATGIGQDGLDDDLSPA